MLIPQKVARICPGMPSRLKEHPPLYPMIGKPMAWTTEYPSGSRMAGSTVMGTAPKAIRMNAKAQLNNRTCVGLSCAARVLLRTAMRSMAPVSRITVTWKIAAEMTRAMGSDATSPESEVKRATRTSV